MYGRKILGSGSYSIVYLHIDEDGREHAVKEQPNTAGGIPTTIIREVIITKKVLHPNIISYTNIEFVGKKTRLTMPLAKTTLNKIVSSSSSEVLRKFFRQICKGLYVLHSNNIIHGDLKGQNILIIDNNAVISDFGISVPNVSNELCNSDLYSLWYRSIDLLLGGTPGFHSDIWALGCILYEMQTNVFLFAEDNEENQIMTILYILNDSWPEIKCLPKWEKKFNRCFSKDPDRVSLKEKLDDTEAFNLVGKMIVANPNERISILEILTSDYLGESKDSVENITTIEKLINNEIDPPKIEKYRNKREEIIKWMIGVYSERYFDLSSLTLAVAIYDKTIERMENIIEDMLQYIAATCLVIAFKLLECEIEPWMVSSLADGTFSDNQITEMIPQVLESLNFDVYYNTIGDFFNYYAVMYSNDVIKLARVNLYCFLLSAKLNETYRPSEFATIAFRLACMFKIKHKDNTDIEIRNEIIGMIDAHPFIKDSFSRLTTMRLNDYISYLKE